MRRIFSRRKKTFGYPKSVPYSVSRQSDTKYSDIRTKLINFFNRVNLCD